MEWQHHEKSLRKKAEHLLFWNRLLDRVMEKAPDPGAGQYMPRPREVTHAVKKLAYAIPFAMRLKGFSDGAERFLGAEKRGDPQLAGRFTLSLVSRGIGEELLLPGGIPVSSVDLARDMVEAPAGELPAYLASLLGTE